MKARGTAASLGLLGLGFLLLGAGCSRLGANEPPVASFRVGPEQVVVGVEVVFDATASADPDGEIVAYRWEFGDGGTAEGAVAAHTYRAAGPNTVVLTVEDNRGATGRAERAILVHEPAGPTVPLVAAFRVPADTVAPYVELTFDASASSAWEAEVVEYRWDFGDGSEDEGVRVRYSYFDRGTFRVRLTVRDSRGRMATGEKTITVIDPPPGNRPPVARFTFSPRAPRVGEEVVFDASPSWDDGAIVDYWWDFGDGTDAAGVAVRHVFGAEGTYEVVLVVVDNFGEEDEVEAGATVR